MKIKNTLLLALIAASSVLSAQNFVVSESTQPKCKGECNGSITFTTSAVTGPFTAVVSNGTACINSTVQNSTVNSITIDSICACSSNYTFVMYSGTVVVGSMIYQFPEYSTQPFNLATNSLVPASCDTCCDGQVYVEVSGGNTNGTPTFSINGVVVSSVTPADSLCAGSYTVCGEDASGCVNCKLFGIGNAFGISEHRLSSNTKIFPNPAGDFIFAETETSGFIGKAVICDITGRKIEETLFAQGTMNKVRVNTSRLGSGLYYLFLYDPELKLTGYKKFAKKTE